jgi:hypothetical protein
VIGKITSKDFSYIAIDFSTDVNIWGGKCIARRKRNASRQPHGPWALPPTLSQSTMDAMVAIDLFYLEGSYPCWWTWHVLLLFGLQTFEIGWDPKATLRSSTTCYESRTDDGRQSTKKDIRHNGRSVPSPHWPNGACRNRGFEFRLLVSKKSMISLGFKWHFWTWTIKWMR